GDIVSKQKERDIKIIDRQAPRVAIQNTEIAPDAKKKIRRRQSVAHLTVTNLSGDEARKLNIKAMRRRAVARIRRTRWNPGNLMSKSHSFERSISQSCLPYWLVTTVDVLRTRRYGLRALFYRSFQRIDFFRTSLFRRMPIGRHIFSSRDRLS